MATRLSWCRFYKRVIRDIAKSPAVSQVIGSGEAKEWCMDKIYYIIYGKLISDSRVWEPQELHLAVINALANYADRKTKKVKLNAEEQNFWSQRPSEYDSW